MMVDAFFSVTGRANPCCGKAGLVNRGKLDSFGKVWIGQRKPTTTEASPPLLARIFRVPTAAVDPSRTPTAPAPPPASLSAGVPGLCTGKARLRPPALACPVLA